MNQKNNKSIPKQLLVTCGLIWKGQRLLLVQRGSQQQHAGQWEFPGGKIEPNETPEACLARELKEELDIEVAVQGSHPPVERAWEQGGTLVLMPFDCQLVRGEPRLLEHQALAWVTLTEALSKELSESDRRIVMQLLG